MKLTSEIVKRAWDTRRKAAKKHNCKIMEISLSECLKFEIACAKAIKKQNEDIKKIREELSKDPVWITDEDGWHYMPVYC